MLIGELATRAGVTQKAVRYYERCGLLKPARTRARYRDFDERALVVVQTIRRGQNLGMQLDELREVVELINRGSTPCETVRNLLAEKRTDVARRIRELHEFDAMLAALEVSEGSDDTQECAILKRAEQRVAPRAQLHSRNAN